MDELYSGVLTTGVVGVTLIALFLFMIYSMEQKGEALDKSCEDIGMTRELIARNTYCVDASDQAHYTTWNCQGFLKPHCSARIVSIGNQ